MRNKSATPALATSLFTKASELHSRSSLVPTSVPSLNMKRRVKSTAAGSQPEHHEHSHSAGENSQQGHSHSHGGIFHSHSAEDHVHSDQSAEALVKYFRGEGLDNGTRITVLGLFTNVGLVAVKGAAGWYFRSAALLAEAGHSLSDLLADFVTLVCWRTSRQLPTDNYPYGFGKFEAMGTSVVSLLLIAAAVAIGHHSWSTVLHVVQPSIAAMQPGIAQDTLQVFLSANMSVLDAAREILPHAHSHGGHTHDDAHGVIEAVDVNAAWFALASVAVKEWIYRLTKKVADEEKSPVLEANAQHHRSDAYSSAVALAAILGSWAIPGLPLDAIGGTLISILIFQQGFGLLRDAMRDLSDAGVSPSTRRSLAKIVEPLITTPTKSTSTSSYPNTDATAILGIRNVRAIKSGSLMFVDLTADVSPLLTMREAHLVEGRIRKTIMDARGEVKEVRVHMHALEDGQTREDGVNGKDHPC